MYTCSYMHTIPASDIADGGRMADGGRICLLFPGTGYRAAFWYQSPDICPSGQGSGNEDYYIFLCVTSPSIFSVLSGAECSSELRFKCLVDNGSSQCVFSR